jgi:trans-2,3-dihydro-3-hydroxyanthranilate isomerase
VLFEEGVGLVPVEIRLEGGAAFARLIRAAEIERPPVERPVRAAAAALSLPERAVLATWSAGVGVPFCFVHLADPDAVDRAVLERAAWASEFARAWAPHLFLFAGTLDAGSRLYARMFAPALGIEEDPATGSGGAALAGCLAERLPTDGSFAWTIDQGVAMGRPSRLEVSAETRGGRAVQVTVGGATVLVGEGTMTVPPGY